MTTKTYALATLVAALAACSSVPDRNAALDDARSRYNAAQADASVTSLAADEIRRAAEALRTAEAARAAGRSVEEVDHLAYLARQRVAIATETARSRTAQAVTAGAGAERDKLRLAVRTAEADAAQRQLAAAQQSNAQISASNAQMSASNAAAQRELAAAQQANAQQSAALAAADAARRADQDRLAEVERQLRELDAKKTDRGMVVTLGDVLFDTGRAELRGDGTRNLARVAEFFKRHPDRRALIEGHTDSVGGADANLVLSQRRADAVTSTLVGMGVAADRLSTQGRGEEMPAASNDSTAGRQMNRRVEIVFTPMPGDPALR